MAMYRVDPWGDDWKQAGEIVSAISWGQLKKPLKPEDVIPWAKTRRHSRQTPSQMMAVLKQAAAQHNASVAAKKPKGAK